MVCHITQTCRHGGKVEVVKRFLLIGGHRAIKKIIGHQGKRDVHFRINLGQGIIIILHGRRLGGLHDLTEVHLMQSLL